jgi:hypothetical protein
MPIMPTSTSRWNVRGVSAGREERGAVGERVGVDQGDRVVERVDAHDSEHGSEDLVAVDRHRGFDLVEQRRSPSTCSSRPSTRAAGTARSTSLASASRTSAC